MDSAPSGARHSPLTPGPRPLSCAQCYRSTVHDEGHCPETPRERLALDEILGVRHIHALLLGSCRYYRCDRHGIPMAEGGDEPDDAEQAADPGGAAAGGVHDQP